MKRSTRTLAGGAVGNLGEQFDYSIFALTAPTLATHFFPESNHLAGLLSTFAVYALAFVARPLGGVVFGYIGDRHGRIAVLTWTVVLMGCGTMVVGLLPTYQSIGVLAPILLVGCRLLQGLSLGGETTGVQSFIAESAPDGQRARWTTLVTSFVYWPVALLGLLILGLRGVLGDEVFDDWGWRLPFLLGGVVAVVGYAIRRRLDDAEEYTEAKTEDERALAAEGDLSAAHSVARALEARRSMLLVILMQPPMALGAYMLTGYMYTFLVEEGGLSATQALVTNGSAVAVLALLLPFTGRLSDRYGRRRMYAAGAAWLFVTAYPAFVLASSGTLVGAFVGQLFLAVGVALYASALFVGLIELFPTAVRCRSHGISYNLSVALFGGTTPLVATALIGATGLTVAPAFYAMALIGTLGLAGILMVPETKDVDLRTSVYRRDARDASRAGDSALGIPA